MTGPTGRSSENCSAAGPAPPFAPPAPLAALEKVSPGHETEVHNGSRDSIATNILTMHRPLTSAHRVQYRRSPPGGASSVSPSPNRVMGCPVEGKRRVAGARMKATAENRPPTTTRRCGGSDFIVRNPQSIGSMAGCNLPSVSPGQLHLRPGT